MSGTFTAQIDAWIARSKVATEAVFKQSAQAVINEMNTPVAKGGNMPVDTGFLRASLQVGIDQIPTAMDKEKPADAAGREPHSGPLYEPDTNAATMAIAGVRFGQTIFATYGANYAIYQENRNGFVRLAAQRWPAIVAQVADEAKARFKR